MTIRSDPPSKDRARARISAAAAKRLFSVGALLSLFAAATYLVPSLHALQPWQKGEDYVPYWNVLGRHLRGEHEELAERERQLERLRREHLEAVEPPPERPTPIAAVVVKPATFPAYDPHPEDRSPPDVEIENASALDHYYGRLTLVELGVPGVLARASHWGDSLLGDDGLPFAIRSRLQARFGDGGHGFHVLAPLNAFYMHRGIQFRVATRWTSRCELLFKCEADHQFGLGGVSTRSSGGGNSRYTTAEEGPGSRVSRFELWHERSPPGGMFEVHVDGKRVGEVDTRASQRSDDVAVFQLDDGPHRINVRAVRGSVRGYGVVLERAGPGVVWENLAVIGTFTNTLNRQDAKHIAGQIRLRKSDLLVFSMGGNDSQRSARDIRENYAAEYNRAISRYRAGRPEASCLVISVTAHGERTQYGDIRVRASVPALVEVQRKVALERGCAFFDLYRAMGGADSIVNWSTARPALLGGDLGHPTSEGHVVLASLVHRSLIRGYADFRRRMVGAPLPDPDGG